MRLPIPYPNALLLSLLRTPSVIPAGDYRGMRALLRDSGRWYGRAEDATARFRAWYEQVDHSSRPHAGFFLGVVGGMVLLQIYTYAFRLVLAFTTGKGMKLGFAETLQRFTRKPIRSVLVV